MFFRIEVQDRLDVLLTILELSEEHSVKIVELSSTLFLEKMGWASSGPNHKRFITAIEQLNKTDVFNEMVKMHINKNSKTKPLIIEISSWSSSW